MKIAICGSSNDSDKEIAGKAFEIGKELVYSKKPKELVSMVLDKLK